MNTCSFILCFFFLSFGLTAKAHGPIHEKIEAVNKKIDKDPFNASLYVERSSYYKIDGKFDNAHGDLIQARRLDPNIITIDFLAAELCFEFEHYHSALSYINVFEQHEISLGETLLLKSKIFDKLFISDSALVYITKAYQYQDRYTTYFFSLASQFSIYNDQSDFESAYDWLKLGKTHLPYDLVLQDQMVKLAIRFEKYEEAEKLCLEQLPKLKRKEQWYFQLAKVYELKGDSTKALEALSHARTSIDKLSKHHQNTDYIKNLIRDIDGLTTQLKQS